MTLSIVDWADLRQAAREAGFKPLRHVGGGCTYFRRDENGFSRIGMDGSVNVSRDYLSPSRRLRISLQGPREQTFLVDPTPAEVFTTAQRLGIGGAW